MSFHHCRPAVFLTLLSVVCPGQGPPGLKVTVEEGADAVVAQSAFSSRGYAVKVSSAEGQPVEGATVTFSLPEQGAFLSGFRRESVVTGADGRAQVRGILWGATAGRAEIRVSAAFGGQRAEAGIPVEVSATLQPARGEREGMSAGGKRGARKWLVLVAVAGGALAGVAVAGKGSAGAAPAAVIAPVVTAPSIGAPSITVGRPQ